MHLIVLRSITRTFENLLSSQICQVVKGGIQDRSGEEERERGERERDGDKEERREMPIAPLKTQIILVQVMLKVG